MKRALPLLLALLFLCPWAGLARAQTVNLTLPVTLSASPALVAGSGFSGATGAAAAVGNSGAAGYSETSICRWDVVPYQAVTGTFRVGIVAFHVEGIRGVAFCLDGGNWVHATQVTTNPTSAVTEYWVPIDTTGLSDALHEVRAIVYPVSGVPRTMEGSDYTAAAQSLFFYSNAHGTYNSTVIYVASNGSNSNNGLTSGAPVQTLAKALDLVSNGGTVRIMTAGTWTLATVSSGPRNLADYNYANWITLEADSSLAQSAVTLTGDGRQHINHLRLRNLTVDQHTLYVYTEVGFQAWADHVAFTNSTGWTENLSNDSAIRYYQSGGTFYNDCTFTDTFLGPTQATIIRNVTLTKVSGDLIDNALLVVNLTASNLQSVVFGTHNDVAQYYGTQTNCIVYGLTATGLQGFQPIFLDQQSSTFRDMAFVNYSVTSIAANDASGQFASPERHVYLKNCTFFNQPLLWRTDLVPDGNGGSIPFSGTNFKLENCTVNSATFTTLQSPASGVTATGTANSGQ